MSVQITEPRGADALTLQQELDRWVSSGLISREQATRIALAEGLPAVARSRAVSTTGGGPVLAAGRAGYVVEALGYVGGVLAVVAGFFAVGALWPGVPTAGQVAFAAAGAVLLVVAGAMVPTGDDPALGRLRAVLWALSTGCVAACTTLLGADVAELSSLTVTLLAGAVTAAWATFLWRRRPAPLQHFVAFAALAVTVGAAVGRLAPDLLPESAGLAVWAFSLAWWALARRSADRSWAAGEPAGAIGALAGATLLMGSPAGDLLAVVTVAGLLTAGVALRRLWLVALGALGVLTVVPQTAASYLPESVAAPLSVFAIGVVMLGVAVRLARTAR
jgi:hypothetical protein